MNVSSEQITGAIDKEAKPVFELLKKEECPPDTREAMRKSGLSQQAVDRIMIEPRNEEDETIFKFNEITLSNFNLTIGILLGSVLERYVVKQDGTISSFGFVCAVQRIAEQKSVDDIINLIWKSK